MERVWPNLNLEPDNDDVCQVCKEMVKEARDQLLSNETQVLNCISRSGPFSGCLLINWLIVRL